MNYSRYISHKLLAIPRLFATYQVIVIAGLCRMALCLAFGSVERKNTEKGAHFVELAIAVPLFIGLLFGVFDTARLALAYSALNAAVYQAGRRAVGIYRPTNNPGLDAIFGNPPPNAPPNYTTDPANLSTVPAPNPYMKGTSANGAWYPSNLTNPIWRPEALAIAYAYQILERSFGSLAWPCTDSPYCTVCWTLRDVDAQYVDLFCDPVETAAAGGDCSTMTQPLLYTVAYLGLRCRMYVPIMTTSIALGWLPSYVPVTATTYVSMENCSDVRR